MREQLDNGQRYAVRLSVERLAPYNARVYDPCGGSSGKFVPSEKFVEEHGGRIGDIAVYGQESNSTTRRLAMMNLAIRGIEGVLGPEPADSFSRDLHKDFKADDVLTNPPFNDSDWHATTRMCGGSTPCRPRGTRLRVGAALYPPFLAERLRWLRAGQRQHEQQQSGEEEINLKALF
jgi:hypothetical protein